MRPLALVLVAGCGGAAGLDPGAVQSIPPGDAQGHALTGHYRFKRITRACDGGCGGTGASGWPISVCDVGEVGRYDADVTQDDGRLTAEVSDTPSLYTGGVNHDGSFDIGAYATQAGTLRISARASGTLGGDGMRGTARSRSWGSYDDVSLDCDGAYDVTPDQ